MPTRDETCDKGDGSLIEMPDQGRPRISVGTIAIVDDNSAILASMRFAMEAHGFKARMYSSPAAFLDDTEVRPACLIVDHNMPGMTGIALVARLREADNGIPVMLTTGYAPPDLIESAASLGIECVAPKPIELDELLRFVGKHC